MPYYAVCDIGAISIASPGLERHRSGSAAAFLGRDFAPGVSNNAAEGLLSKRRVPRAFVTDSHQVLVPFRFLLIAVAGWMNQQRQSASYLQTTLCQSSQHVRVLGRYGVLLGDTHDRGLWDTSVDPAATERILRENAALFGSMRLGRKAESGSG